MDRKNSSTKPLKIEAKVLRKYLAEQGIELGHSKCLEAVAQMHGFKNWDTAVALFDAGAPEQVPASTQEARSMAQAVRREAGWGKSWPFPWESPEASQGTAGAIASALSEVLEDEGIENVHVRAAEPSEGERLVLAHLGVVRTPPDSEQFRTVRELLDELVYYDMGGDAEIAHHNGLERYKLLSVVPYDDSETLRVGFKIEVEDVYLDKKGEKLLCIHIRDARASGAWGRALSTPEGRAYVAGHWRKTLYWMQESPRDEEHGVVLFDP